MVATSLRELRKDGNPHQLVVLGVDQQEDHDTVQKFIRQVGAGFPVLLDADGSVAQMYDVTHFPSTFFIDAKGILRAQQLGALTDDLMIHNLQLAGMKP